MEPFGRRKDVSDLVQDAEIEPPLERPVHGGVIAVGRRDLPPQAAGVLAVQDAVEGAARIDAGTAGRQGGVEPLEDSRDAPPILIRYFPSAFRGALRRSWVPRRTPHTVKI